MENKTIATEENIFVPFVPYIIKSLKHTKPILSSSFDRLLYSINIAIYNKLFKIQALGSKRTFNQRKRGKNKCQ
jgi:hypothetical protein